MNQLERFKHINTFIFDVDGVFTNSQLLVLDDGALLRSMNTRDGYAVKRAIDEGYRIAIITGGNSEGVEVRLKRLGVEEVYKGVKDKQTIYQAYIEKHELDEENILFMGDDLPDYLIMRTVGLPACPRDAAPEIIEVAQYISPKNGGAGCVRDVIEKVMRLHGKWFPY